LLKLIFTSLTSYKYAGKDIEATSNAPSTAFGHSGVSAGIPLTNWKVPFLFK